MHVIDFFIVAFVMFLVIKGINTLKRKEEAESVAEEMGCKGHLLKK